MKPSSVEINLTNQCNLRCIMCTGASKVCNDIPQSMCPELFSKIVNEINGQKTSLILIGGEPMLYFNDKQYLYDEMFDNEFIIPQFITNGFLLDKQTKLLNLMNDHNWRIEFSIEGIDDTYNNLRRGSDFDVILNNIKLAVNMKNKNSSLSIVGINYIATQKTMEELVDFVILMGEVGVDYIHVHHLIFSPTAEQIYGFNFFDYCVKNEKEYLYLIDNTIDRLQKENANITLLFDSVGKQKKYYAGFNQSLNINFNDDYQNLFYKIHDPYKLKGPFPKSHCAAPFREMLINSQGMVHPCCASGNLIMGNCNQNNIYDIFENQNYQKIRNDLLSHKPDYCCCHETYHSRNYESSIDLANDKKHMASNQNLNIYYDDEIKKFKSLVAEKKIDEAIGLLESIETTEFNTHCIKIWNELAGVYLYRKNCDSKALVYINKILDIMPNSVEAKIKKANVLSNQKKYDIAISVLQSINDSGEKFPLIYFWLGFVYEQISKWNEMKENYSKFVELFDDEEVWGYRHAQKMLKEVCI